MAPLLNGKNNFTENENTDFSPNILMFQTVASLGKELKMSDYLG